jgi:hypothetical protein
MRRPTIGEALNRQEYASGLFDDLALLGTQGRALLPAIEERMRRRMPAALKAALVKAVKRATGAGGRPTGCGTALACASVMKKGRCC